jgi:hypothetical protein
MTTPLKELLALVPTLNDPKEPFAFEVKGDKLIGKWDIVRAKTLYPKEFKTIDKKFSVTVEFDEKKGTFKSKDKAKSTESSVTSGGISFGTNSFSGKMAGKEKSFEFGGISKNKDEDLSLVLAYSFDTGRIKTPLFDFLEKNGWKRKKGLFG